MKPPLVVTFYKMYCGAMVLLYLLFTIAGAVALLDPKSLGDAASDPALDRLQWIVFVAASPPLAILHFVAALLPARPSSWVVGLVVIGLAVGTCCCLPISLPLLIYWLKPETKAFFGRP